jgi:hypothetical protein
MKQKLFIICPFSHIEPFLKLQYGDSHLFLTYPLATITSIDNTLKKTLKALIKAHQIKEIIIVNDVSCLLTNEVIQRERNLHFPIQRQLEFIYLEHYLRYFYKKSTEQKAINLCKINLELQYVQWHKNPILKSIIEDQFIEIKAILSNKNKNQFLELHLNHLINKKYEY